MRTISLFPVHSFDIITSALVVILATLALAKAYEIYRSDKENIRYNYLLWVAWVLFAFSVSRAGGHLLKYALLFSGHEHLWTRLSPVVGGFNSIAFVLIGAVTLFFHRIQTIFIRMVQDRQKIEKISLDLLQLNQDLEAIVFERTTAELALKIAHKVRNPAMIIGGLVRRILKDLPPDDSLRNRMEKIFEQVQKLETLVQEFEQLMAKRSYFFTTIELNELVKSAIEMIQPEIEEKGIQLQLKLSTSKLTFKGNARLIKVALVHVIRNAIEATPSGGEIWVETGIKDSRLFVRIRDSGRGIPKEIMAHIFEPFYSTKERGTGLGLPYVRQIVQEHRGRITIRSAPGEGTEVTMAFPTHLTELSGAQEGR